MNNFNLSDTRNRRNLLNWTGIFPFHSVTNYSTDSTKMKIDMKNVFGDALFINNLHLIPDPLKKNLADSIITEEVKTKTNMATEQVKPEATTTKEHVIAEHQTDSYPSLGIITNFISGVFSFVSGAMFHKRTNSPTQYYECFDQNLDESAPSLQAWQQAKIEDQNKNGWAHQITVCKNEPNETIGCTMNEKCRTASNCEEKINQVCLFLANQQTRMQTKSSQNLFVEENSTDDCFEDAFTSEDFESLPDTSYLEYYGPFNHQKADTLVSDAPRIKNEYIPLTENMEIVNPFPDIIKDSVADINTPMKADTDNKVDSKADIVSSCEDKMCKLKALLEKNKINKDKNSLASYDVLNSNEQQSKPILIPNSNRNNSSLGDITEIISLEKCISPSALSTEDCDTSDQSSLTESQCSNSTPEYLDPCNYFDEVTGRFYSTSADSDDSFQIVFDDSSKSCRGRLTSECDSEDSFIIFDDSPDDSCYSSNDVFGDELNVTGYDFIESSDSEGSEDSDSENDSGCETYNLTCKLSHSLTRTIGDLTDDSLYNVDEDEVDCAARFVEEKSYESISNVYELNEDNSETQTKQKGLLIDEKRKIEKRCLPRKTVRFSPNPPKVHIMRVWAFAARQARAGHWERHALDRERFKRRIADVEMAVSWVLKPQHRARIMFQRFMPWWNAQKRIELAEKELREEDEKKAEIKIDDTNDAKLISEPNLYNDNSDQEKCEKKLDVDIEVQEIKKANNLYESNKQNKKTKNVKTDMCAVEGKILLNDDKKNGLKFAFHGNDIDVST
ncbi:uncharacterized protein PPP1R15 [Battus philenor]|uniref:uncharacterized protein PPP1R15 n=1 Tax=Battus philenor TaxID=42288 RepID=UPI0035D09C08